MGGTETAQNSIETIKSITIQYGKPFDHWFIGRTKKENYANILDHRNVTNKTIAKYIENLTSLEAIEIEKIMIEKYGLIGEPNENDKESSFIYFFLMLPLTFPGVLPDQSPP